MIQRSASAPISSETIHRPMWTSTWRAVIFILSATSIWCLLAEFYGLCSMRTFIGYALIPSTLATNCAHLIFGIALGLLCRKLARAGTTRAVLA